MYARYWSSVAPGWLMMMARRTPPHCTMIIIIRKHTAVAVRGVLKRVVSSREKATSRLPHTKKKRKTWSQVG